MAHFFARRTHFACDSRMAVCFDLFNVQKCATKSDTLGHCLSCISLKVTISSFTQEMGNDAPAWRLAGVPHLRLTWSQVGGTDYVKLLAFACFQNSNSLLLNCTSSRQNILFSFTGPGTCHIMIKRGNHFSQLPASMSPIHCAILVWQDLVD